jgi:hypothetical protein
VQRSTGVTVIAVLMFAGAFVLALCAVSFLTVAVMIATGSDAGEPISVAIAGMGISGAFVLLIVACLAASVGAAMPNLPDSLTRDARLRDQTSHDWTSVEWELRDLKLPDWNLCDLKSPARNFPDWNLPDRVAALFASALVADLRRSLRYALSSANRFWAAAFPSRNKNHKLSFRPSK